MRRRPWLTIAIAALAGRICAAYEMSSTCRALNVQRADPMLTPKAVSSHANFFYGGSGMDLEIADADVMRKSSCTSCSKLADYSS